MKFALYYTETCPFCVRVLMALPNIKVEVEKRNLRSDPKWRQELSQATGRTTVPCLKITNDSGKEQWMFESADIIRYLQKA